MGQGTHLFGNGTMSENFKALLEESRIPTTEAGIKQEFEHLTVQENFITNTSPYSPFWRLVTAVAVKPVKWLTDYLIDEVLPNLFVKTAKGKWLQIQAWSVGLDFKEASKTQGFVTFTKADANMVVTVKQGTIVQTERINNKVYRLIVDKDTAIERGKLSGKVPVTAEEAGAGYNLANGYYCILPEAISGIKEARNEEDWLSVAGADRESDEELRNRYRAKFSSVGKHHIDSVYKSLVAEIAGISIDRIYILHDAPRGPGTANIYLLLDKGVNSQPFIDLVNRYLNEQGYHGHGDDIRTFKMPEVVHNIGAALYFRSSDGVSQLRKAEIKKEVEQMIRCAFRENATYPVTKTHPYQRFSFSKLGEEIHEQFPEIKSIVWEQDDIVNALNIPTIGTLNLTLTE